MNIKELLANVDTDVLIGCIMSNYFVDIRDKEAVKKKYKGVISDIIGLPFERDDGLVRLSIKKDGVFYKMESETKKNKYIKYEAIAVGRDKVVDEYGNEANIEYDVGLIKWSKLVGLDIEDETGDNLDDISKAVILLTEMTFWGYSMKEIDGVAKKIFEGLVSFDEEGRPKKY